jgi:hypothetical protein
MMIHCSTKKNPLTMSIQPLSNNYKSQHKSWLMRFSIQSIIQTWMIIKMNKTISKLKNESIWQKIRKKIWKILMQEVINNIICRILLWIFCKEIKNGKKEKLVEQQWIYPKNKNNN